MFEIHGGGALVASLSEGWIGDWSPGVGDPTPIAWMITCGYLVVAGFCYAATRSLPSKPRGVRLYWMGLTATIFFLGFNKQLDLQSLAVELVHLALPAGSHQELKDVLRLTLGGFGAALLAASTIFVAWKLRYADLRDRLSLGGLGILLVFVLLRVSALVGVTATYQFPFTGGSRGWMIEMLGIFVVGLAAERKWRLAQAKKPEEASSEISERPERRASANKEF